MAICPEHGHYEKECKKCRPGPGEIIPEGLHSAPMPSLAPAVPDPDKYILRSFEVECLTAQIETQNAQQKWQNAQQALNRHAQVVFEKLGISPKDWILDTKSMTLVKRGE